jgi:hypothetical protein
LIEPSDQKEPKGGAGGYSPHMKGVAWGILVMGLSLTAIIVLWTTIGYQGPDFSIRVMEQQQEWLHDLYGLPEEVEISPELLEVPPSLRGTITAGDNTTEDVRPT